MKFEIKLICSSLGNAVAFIIFKSLERKLHRITATTNLLLLQSLKHGQEGDIHYFKRTVTLSTHGNLLSQIYLHLVKLRRTCHQNLNHFLC